MLVWIIFVLLIAAVLMIGVELAIKRLGIVPQDETSGGLHDVLMAWRKWLERHQR